MTDNAAPNNDFSASVLTGQWSYRSFNNNPDLSVDPNDLLFGSGTIRIDPAPMDTFTGLIYGTGWQLNLNGSIAWGNPYTVNFLGSGVVGGSEWKYSYRGYYVPRWPNGVNQVPAMVGSIVRDIPHPGGDGGLHPAGVVASWYAVKQG